jgi:hypothetical protein
MLKPFPHNETVERSSFVTSPDAKGWVKIRYARTDEHPYGTLGALRTVHWSPGFAERVDHFVANLAFLMEQSPFFGPLTSIVLGGAWHDKWRTDQTHKVCRHCQGRAIDIDALWWADAEGQADQHRLLMTEALADPRRYNAVEGFVRANFGTTLSYRYFDKEHRDHFHADDGTDPEWRPSEGSGAPCSRVLFVQGSAKDVHGQQISSINGSWCEETAKAVLNILTRAGKDYGVSDKKSPRVRAHEMMLAGGYLDFCKLTAIVGMGLSSLEMAGPVISLLL